MKTIVSLLQNIPLFQELSEEDLQEIAPLFTENPHGLSATTMDENGACKFDFLLSK